MSHHMTYEECSEVISGLQSILPTIKAFPVTTRTKGDHWGKVVECKALLEDCGDVHNMYRPGTYWHFDRYNNAVNIHYYEITKKELDTQLAIFKRELIRNITEHVRDLENLQSEIVRESMTA
jgi:hypothetical protein